MASLNLKEKETAKRVQQALNITADGIWGPKSQQALINFQKANGLTPDGIIGRKTIEALGLLDTDLTNKTLSIENYFLSDGQYIKGYYDNDYIFLHHTAGWNNPYDTVNIWNTDSLGRVGAEFVIGGKNPKNGDDKYDGKIIKAFPDNCQAYHLGTNNNYLNLHSVGIELCNFGWIKNGMTYSGALVQNSQIIKINSFRGYTDWHKYSERQIESLRKLLLFIANRDNIDLHEGLYKRIRKNVKTAFDYDDSLAKGKTKGLLSHGNVRKDKFDVSPQPNLIDMILSL